MALGLSSVRIFKIHCNHLIVPHTSIKPNYRLWNSISVANHPCSLYLIRARQPITITCARNTRKRGGSQPPRNLMLELASMLASNLNILPPPLNSLIGEFARRYGNEIFFELLEVLKRGVLNGRGREKQSSGKLSWLVLALISGMGVVCWKISEFDMFLRVSCFSLVGLSMIQLWRRKAFKEWILGFLFGIVLLSCRIGKEETKFLVERLQIPSSVAQIVTKHRNRSKRKWGKAW